MSVEEQGQPPTGHDHLSVPGPTGSQSNATQHQLVSNVMMPWFMSASWVPKFTGEGGSIGFNMWRAKVDCLLRAQGLNSQQSVDFVLDALEGWAQRQMMLLPPTRWLTAEAILEELAKIYGDHRRSAALRSDFFDCKQDTGEGVEAFILHLCEFHSRWQKSDPGNAGPRDKVLKAQFTKGLRDTPLKLELERYLRRTPGASFDAVCTEAKALEKEVNRKEMRTCRTYTIPQAPQPPIEVSTPADWQQLKETLRTELRQEVKEQVTLLGKTIVQEICAQLPAIQSTARPGQSRQLPYRRRQQPGRDPQPYRWDEQGRPICLDCGEAGHIQRHCPRRHSHTAGFRNPPPPGHCRASDR